MKTLLLGLNNPETLKETSKFAEGHGYEVIATSDYKKYSSLAKARDYDSYLLEIITDTSNGDGLACALEVFDTVQALYEHGFVRFLAISGNREMVNLALSKGIPCDPKGFGSINGFLSE